MEDGESINVVYYRFNDIMVAFKNLGKDLAFHHYLLNGDQR